MKLILENGDVHELTDWDKVVLDCALVAFNATKENASYFDEQTRRDIYYAAYENLRTLIPFLGNEKE